MFLNLEESHEAESIWLLTDRELALKYEELIEGLGGDLHYVARECESRGLTFEDLEGILHTIYEET